MSGGIQGSVSRGPLCIKPGMVLLFPLTLASLSLSVNWTRPSGCGFVAGGHGMYRENLARSRDASNTWNRVLGMEWGKQ